MLASFSIQSSVATKGRSPLPWPVRNALARTCWQRAFHWSSPPSSSYRRSRTAWRETLMPRAFGHRSPHTSFQVLHMDWAICVLVGVGVGSGVRSRAGWLVGCSGESSGSESGAVPARRSSSSGGEDPLGSDILSCLLGIGIGIGTRACIGVASSKYLFSLETTHRFAAFSRPFRARFSTKSRSFRSRFCSKLPSG